jgi:hypothetical protein
LVGKGDAAHRSSGLCLHGPALSLHREGDDRYASGVIRVGDDLALRQAAEQAPIRRLVLLNSPGGALMGAEPAQP